MPEPAPRIGYVIKRFPRLSETFILNELTALLRHGLQVEVYSLLEPEQNQQQHLLEQLDIKAHYLPGRDAIGALPVSEWQVNRSKPMRQRTLRRCLKPERLRALPPFPGKRFSQCATLELQAATLAILAQAHDISHLHAHFASDAATIAMLAARLADLPYSITAHAKDIYHIYSEADRDRAFLARKLREARFTLTVSDYNREYLGQLAGPQARIIRLYNGVDLQRLKIHDRPREHHLLVAVGRLVEKKGFADLVEACHWLHQAGVKFECVIIGDGPEQAHLAERIRALNLDTAVYMLGAMPQEQVFTWLKKATVFVLPAVISSTGDRDGLPTVILECMALGTPVISTQVAGIPEMIKHGQSGWLCPPNDPQALASQIQQVLAMTPSERTDVAQAARARAEQLFDLDHNTAQLKALFEQSAQGHHPTPLEVD